MTGADSGSGSGMPAGKRFVLLGHISAAHGLKGEVLIKSHTEEPAAIGTYGPLTDETRQRRIEIRGARATAKGVIARIAGVGDRSAAEALRGTKLYVAREQLPAAEANAYYHADLIGLAAVDEAGQPVGRIVGVDNFGAGDLLAVTRTGERQSELVPFTSDFVPEVDIAAGCVVVRMPVVVEVEPDPSASDSGSSDPKPNDRGATDPGT